MKDCFGLRFNCQKSGWDIPDDAELMAKVFGEKTDDISKLFEDYKSINGNSLSEISNCLDIQVFREKFKDKKILFVGDSMTSDRLSYQKIIAEALPNQVFDRAISGSFSINLVAQIDRHLNEIKPDYVSVMVGGNDSVFFDKRQENAATSSLEYQRNLNLIIDKVTAFGAKVILNAVCPIYADLFNKNNMFWSANNENNEKYNEIAKNVAKKRNVAFNDYRFLFDIDDLSVMFEPDGIHPSPLAHKEMAKTVIKTLLEI